MNAIASAKSSPSSPTSSSSSGRGVWSPEEHDRFLEALKKFPHGPWRDITNHVGSRSIRQVQTHAQKYQEKIMRRLRGVRCEKKLRLRQEHRIDHDMLRQHTLLSVSSDKIKTPLPSQAQQHQASPLVQSTDPTSPDAISNLQVTNDPMTLADVFAKPLPLPMSPLILDDEEMTVETTVITAELVDSLAKVDELPSLSESLDFFIKCFS